MLFSFPSLDHRLAANAGQAFRALSDLATFHPSQWATSMIFRETIGLTGLAAFAEQAHNDLAPFAEGRPMRQWLLLLTPVALVAYFVMYPANFFALVRWIANLIR